MAPILLPPLVHEQSAIANYKLICPVRGKAVSSSNVDSHLVVCVRERHVCALGASLCTMWSMLHAMMLFLYPRQVMWVVYDTNSS